MTGQLIVVILHVFVIALGVGLSFSNFINTRLALTQGADVAKGLALQRRTIARIADGVIALIWVTGLLLLWMRGMQGLPGSFHAKLLFVVLLTLFHGLTRALGEKMRRENNTTMMPRLSLLIGCGFASAVVALVLAVITFGG